MARLSRWIWCLLLLLPLRGEAQTITQQPLIHGVGPDSVRIQWETDSAPGGVEHAVDYGLASVSEEVAVSPGPLVVDGTHVLHRVALQGLQAGREYRYRVRSGAAVSGEFLVRTAPPPGGDFRMAWLADSQSGSPFGSVLAALLPRDVDWIAVAGDQVGQGDQVDHWRDHWYVKWTNQGLGQDTPVLSARGNHDGESAVARAYLWLPGNGSYWAQTLGRVRLIALDSNPALRTQGQTDWLAAELASAETEAAEYVVVYFHHPPYTNLWCNTLGYNGEPFVRANWVPLFEQHGVDLVVNGHAHAYLRGQQNGVTYAIVGGAGGPLDSLVPPVTWDLFDVELSVHHYAVMDVDDQGLHWAAYDPTGVEIDAFQLGGALPVGALGASGRVALGALVALLLARVAHGRWETRYSRAS